MASEVEICNLALSHLGDTATVASLEPPEGSAQAEHCARFFPIARDALLETHNWNFATRRVQLALLSSESTAWDFAYAFPADAMTIMDIFPPDFSDDTSTAGLLVPQPYCVELASDGARVIYSDQEDAIARYSAFVTDTSRFPPLFVMALSYSLAALLAGPLIKGDVGAAEAKRCAALAKAYQGLAVESDAGQRSISVDHRVSWLANR